MRCFRGGLTLGVHKIPFRVFSSIRGSLKSPGRSRLTARTRVRPSCLEAGMGKHSRWNMTESGLFKHPLTLPLLPIELSQKLLNSTQRRACLGGNLSCHADRLSINQKFGTSESSMARGNLAPSTSVAILVANSFGSFAQASDLTVSSQTDYNRQMRFQDNSKMQKRASKTRVINSSKHNFDSNK